MIIREEGSTAEEQSLPIRFSPSVLGATKIAADVIVWLLAAPLAFLIRYDGAIPADSIPVMVTFTGSLALVKLALATRHDD